MVYMEEGELLVPLDSMGDAFQRLAHHKRMGKYVTASARCACSCGRVLPNTLHHRNGN